MQPSCMQKQQRKKIRKDTETAYAYFEEAWVTKKKLFSKLLLHLTLPSFYETCNICNLDFRKRCLMVQYLVEHVIIKKGHGVNQTITQP